MSPVKVFFILALAVVAVFAASEDESVKEKRSAYAYGYPGAYGYAGVLPYAAHGYAAGYAGHAYGAYPYAYGHDDGRYFPGKYPGTGFPYTSGIHYGY